MSRPVVIALTALVAGIVLADQWLYDAPLWAEDKAKASWMLVAPWGFCLLMALMAAVAYVVPRFKRARWRWGAIGTGRGMGFAVLTALFFVSLGFGRYALDAERQARAWRQGVHPHNHGNPDEFDYVRWRWVQGETETGRGQELRVRLVKRLSMLGLTDEALGVVVATSLGDRSLLSRETRDRYAAAGASHLLALSGLHLGILVGVLVLLFRTRLSMSRWRWLAGVCGIVLIWSYALLAGLPTSLVRASLMLTLFLLGSMMQRQRYSLHLLLLTALIMLLAHPFWLFDVGAQLSFLATMGIVLFYGRLSEAAYRRWHFQLYRLDHYGLLWPFRLVAVSLCAQALTWPLVAYYFHQVPLYGALLSVVLIPLTTVVLYGTLAALLLSFIVPVAAQWVGVVLSLVVATQGRVMAEASTWPCAVVRDCWSRKASAQLVIYNNRRCPALHVIGSPSSSVLLMPEPEEADEGLYYIRRSFWLRRLTAPPHVVADSRLCLPGMKIAMVCGSRHELEGKADTVDVLWVTRGFTQAWLGNVAARYRPRLLVLDASLPRWQRKALTQEASHLHWPTYDIAERGALRLRLAGRGE